MRPPSISTLLLLVLLSLTATLSVAQSCKISKEARRKANTAVYTSLRRQMRRNPSLIAVFIRAAFHDCITATRTRRGSGCNGSLQFELDDPNNNRLDPFVPAVRKARASTGNTRCVSVADSIQLGLSAALRRIDGPKLQNRDLVDENKPRRDATSADDSGELPSGGFTFAQTVAFYKRKGFSDEEAVLSNVGGHSVGGFVPQGGSTVLPFVPAAKFSTLYAENLFNRSVSGRGKTPQANKPNALGFNTLPSDEGLVSTPRAFRLMRQFAGVRFKDGEPQFNRKRGKRKLSKKFVRFLLRVSRLSDKTVGNSDKLNKRR